MFPFLLLILIVLTLIEGSRDTLLRDKQNQLKSILEGDLVENVFEMLAVGSTERRILQLIQTMQQGESMTRTRGALEYLRLVVEEKKGRSSGVWKLVEEVVVVKVLRIMERALWLEEPRDIATEILPQEISMCFPNANLTLRTDALLWDLSTQRTLRAVYLRNAIVTFINYFSQPSSIAYYRISEFPEHKSASIIELLESKVRILEDLGKALLSGIKGGMKTGIARYLHLMLWMLMEDGDVSVEDACKLTLLEARLGVLLCIPLDDIFPLNPALFR